MPGDAPTARAGAVLAAAPDGSVWLHGGIASGQSLGDLWRFDGSSWTNVTASGAAPAPRQDHLAVWDAGRDRLIVGFGQDSAGTVFDDVWAFDPTAGTWTPVGEGGPDARYGSCAVLDERDRLVITHGFSSLTRFDDTWALDLATSTWTDISPTVGPRPVARCLHACTYDRTTGALTLFGGRQDDDPYLGDTWRLTGTGWVEVPGAGPEPRVRSRGGLVGAELWVVGGTGESGIVGDAWVLAGDTWRPGPAGPPADRDSAAVAQADGAVWLFGGDGADGELGDLWRLG